jgi:SAM-dependent methyltransferase
VNVLENLHGSWIYEKRIARLSTLLSDLFPANSSLLDVGCGDAKLAWSLLQKRPDLRIEGSDVLVREKTYLPVRQYDGSQLPYQDLSFDGTMLIDVLHHTQNPELLLREALRVSRRWLIVKDHILQGPFAALRLRFMDYVGNARHGVALPFNYLAYGEWDRLRKALNLETVQEVTKLHLYPWFLDIFFGADLHFVAFWERRL